MASPKRLYPQTLAEEPNSKTLWLHNVGPCGVCSSTYAFSGLSRGSCLYAPSWSCPQTCMSAVGCVWCVCMTSEAKWSGVWWKGWSCMMQVELWPLRRQSSPRRILSLPSDPVCLMLKAMATLGSVRGRGRRVRSYPGGAIVVVGQDGGCLNGPFVRPALTSCTISSSMNS